MKFSRMLRNRRDAWSVLALGLALSGLGWQLAASRMEAEQRRDLELNAALVRNDLERRLERFENAARGLQGLVAATPDFDRRGFRRYAEKLGLRKRDGGYYGVVFSRYVRDAELAGFVDAVRRDRSLGPGEYPPFQLKMGGRVGDHLVVAYAEPSAQLERYLGMDFLARTGMRPHLERARDEGKLTASQRLELRLGPGESSAFALSVPVYSSDLGEADADRRRDAFVGAITFGLSIKELIEDVLREHAHLGVSLQVVDLGPSAVADFLADGSQVETLFRSSPLTEDGISRSAMNPEDAGRRVYSSQIAVGGRTWQLMFEAEPPVNPGLDHFLPLIVLLGGAVASVLLFMLVWSLAAARDGAHARAADASQDLDEQIHLANEILDRLPIPILFKDTEGRYVRYNRAFEAFHEADPGYWRGRTIEEMLPERSVQSHKPVDDRLLSEGGVATYECEARVASGARKQVLFHKSAFTRRDGSIAGIVVAMTDITERKLMEERAQRLADHDTLTGVPNRRLLYDRIQNAIAHGARHGVKTGLLFIDLDRFKNINDSLGHEVGDRLLKMVAERLCACVRAEDTVARWGGDEFVVLLKEIREAPDAGRVAQKVLDALGVPFLIDGHELHVTPSAGICVCPDDGADSDTLLKHADVAMYRAKEEGRNGFRFFTVQMNEAAERRLELENDLRKALRNGEFALHYQPQVDLHAGRILGAEALLRWNHPAKGMIPPAQFIPVAEESGLIVPLGDWVLHTACCQAAEWLAAGLPALRIAVNISGRQFRDGGLVEGVERVLGESGLPAEFLELELTESLLMQHEERTMRTLEGLNAMGIVLSVDDFGTGYSSLAYLKRFPIRKLKIDQSFVRDIGVDPQGEAIVRAVIALARSLRLEVIAEGVETAAQEAFLRAHGCEEAQGYLFGRPVPPAQLAAQVAAQAWAQRRPIAA